MIYQSTTTDSCDRVLAGLMRDYLVENGYEIFGADRAVDVEESATWADLGRYTTTDIRLKSTPTLTSTSNSFGQLGSNPLDSDTTYTRFFADGVTIKNHSSSLVKVVRGIILCCPAEEVILYYLKYPEPITFHPNAESNINLEFVFDAYRGR